MVELGDKREPPWLVINDLILIRIVKASLNKNSTATYFLVFDDGLEFPPVKSIGANAVKFAVNFVGGAAEG